MPLTVTSLACLAVAAAAALPTSPVVAPRPADGYLLQYRFRTGETIRYAVEHEELFIASAGGVRDKQETETHTDRRYEVVDVADDGAMTLRFSLERARMQVVFDDGKPVAFDSKSPEEAPRQFAGVGKAIGRQLAEVRLAPDGTVKDVRPLLSPEELAEMPGLLGLGNDKNADNNLFVVFPQRPIKIGEEWSHTFSIRVPINNKLTQEVKILSQYRLESVENGVAAISVRTSPLTILTEPSLLVQIIRRTSSGTFHFDLEAGRMLGRTTKFDNMELGWAGADSSLRVISTTTERIAAEQAKISAR